jgi:hypothetical protein
VSLQQVKPGQPYRPSASAHNTFVGAARYVQSLQAGHGREPLRDNWQATIVQVKNNSGGDRQRFDVLGIGNVAETVGVFPTPTDNLDAFKNGPILLGYTPDGWIHKGKFAVLLEPAKIGAIAAACVAGTCVANVTVNNPEHQYAEAKDADAGSLTSCLHGSAQILWIEAGASGVKWAVVRLGVAPSGRFYAKAQADWQENGTYPYGYPRVSCKLYDYRTEGEYGDAFWVQLPRDRPGTPYLDHGADPAVYEDDILQWEYDSAGVPVCASEYLHMQKIGDIRIQGLPAIIPVGWNECDGSSQTGNKGTFNLVDFATTQQPVGGSGTQVAAMPRHKSAAENIGSNNSVHLADAFGETGGVVLVPTPGSALDTGGDTMTIGMGAYRTATVLYIQRYK